MKKYSGITNLVERFASQNDVTKKEAEKAVKGTIEALKAELLDNDNDGVQLIGFITLEKVQRASREGRNPRTKEPITIPAKMSLKIKVGSDLSTELNNN